MNREPHSLPDYLAAWDGRRKARQAALWLPRGALAGLTVAGLVVLASRLRPLLTPLELTGVVLLIVLLAAGTAAGVAFLQRRSLLEQARYADHELGLKERATTAVELESGLIHTTPALARQQLDDALSVAGRIDPQLALPVRLRRGELLAAVALLLLLLVVIWLPNAQNALLQLNQAVESAISSEATGVGELAGEIEQNEALSPEQQGALTEPLADAQAALSEPNIDQAEAVAALSEAEAELRELAASFDQSALQSALEEAAGGMGDSAAAETLNEAFAAGDLGAAAEAAEQLAAQTGTLDAAAQEELAADLHAAGEALAAREPELAETLQEAAEALEMGEPDAAAEALRESAAALQDRATQQAAASQAQEAADRLQDARETVARAGGDAQQQAGAAAESAESQDAGSAGEPGGEPGDSAGGEAAEQGAPGAAGGAQSGLEQSTGPSQGGGRSASVFVPPPVDLSDETGSDVELPANCLANPASCGPRDETDDDGEQGEARRPEGSSVPYQDVFGEYSDAAFEALDTEYIPLGLQELVRRYFSSLEP